MAEIGEGADHTHSLIACQSLEQFFHLPVSLGVGIAAETDRQNTHAFDQSEGRDTLLLTDDVSEQPSQEPDVFNQGCFVRLG